MRGGTNPMASWRMGCALWFAIMVASAQVSDLSGTWALNVQQSRWGKHPQPTSGIVVIEHHEPALKYSGTVQVQHGTETADTNNTFSFNGAIDGKEYPVRGTAGTMRMTIRRVNPTTTLSDLKAGDGTVVERAKTTVSADGKRLTREVRATGPAGE